MPKYSILIVDDDDSILETLKDIFWMEGYEVSTVNTGESAIRLIGEKYFDLVVTDLKMSDIDGLEVVNKAKKIHPDCGVIIHTAYANLSSAIEALRLGADDYFQKPCSPQEFLFRVEKCLGKYEVIKKVKSFEAILPVCCRCKKIRYDSEGRRDNGDWINLEEYLSANTNARISPSLCDKCSDEAKKATPGKL